MLIQEQQKHSSELDASTKNLKTSCYFQRPRMILVEYFAKISLQKCAFILPQGSKLHMRSRKYGPLHILPPNLGAGLLHCLYRRVLPPLHSLEQRDHGPHGPQLPSTDSGFTSKKETMSYDKSRIIDLCSHNIKAYG